jgi:hypothetical protein
MTPTNLTLTLLAAAALAASTTLAGEPVAAAAIDGRGDVHQVRATGAGAEYGYCAAGCSATGEAKASFALEAPATHVAAALGADGKPRLVLETRNRVHFAICEGDCTKAGGWTTTVAVEHGGRYALDTGSLSVGAGGAVSFRIVPQGAEGPARRAFVASCAGGCGDAARWTVHLDLPVAEVAAAAVAVGR